MTATDAVPAVEDADLGLHGLPAGGAALPPAPGPVYSRDVASRSGPAPSEPSVVVLGLGNTVRRDEGPGVRALDGMVDAAVAELRRWGVSSCTSSA